MPFPNQSSLLRWPRLCLQLGQGRLSAMVAATGAAGFFIARPDTIRWGGFWGITLGIFFAAVCANTLNQLIERRLDAKVKRTASRPLPSGRTSPRQALVWAVIAGALALGLMLACGGPLAAILGMGNIALYAGVYTPLKTRTSLNMIVGAVVGAVPPVIGWLAATGRFEPGTWVLAALLFAWQVPHALAMAWPERHDSAAVGFCHLPGVEPTGTLTATAVVVYSAALLPIGLAATVTGVAGPVYALGSVTFAVIMLVAGFGLWRHRTDASARRLFRASLLYLPALLLLMSLDSAPANTLAASQPAPANSNAAMEAP